MTAPALTVLDITSLRWALTVAELGGFRRAANLLGVEQSAVSRRVRTLEEGLGVSLFQRSARGVALTNAGMEFIAVVENALALLTTAVADAGVAGMGQKGRLRIGLTAPSIADFLMGLLERFQGSHPKVRIEVSDGSADDHVAAVEDRRLDLAVLPGGTIVSGLDVSELWREPLQIALPASHRLSAAEIVRLDDVLADHLLVSTRDLGRRDIALLTTAAGVPFDLESTDAGATILIGMTKLNLGLTVVSAGAVAAMRLPDGVVVRPLESLVNAPFAVAWSAANDNPALRRFVSAVRSVRGSAERARRGAAAPASWPPR